MTEEAVQLRIECAFPIARNTQVQLGILGQHRLLRIAIAVIGLARRRLAIEMVVQFRVQDALGQRFLQLVEKPILGKHLLRIAPRQKLVQRALLDRHSPPPAASLWPHTRFPTVPRNRAATAPSRSRSRFFENVEWSHTGSSTPIPMNQRNSRSNSSRSITWRSERTE